MRRLLPKVSKAARIEDPHRSLVWWWCDAVSCRGSLVDRAGQTATRRAAEALLSHARVRRHHYARERLLIRVSGGNNAVCDGVDDADFRHRLAIAQTTFGSLSSIMDRHPVVERVEVEDVPACRVFDADTRISRLDADYLKPVMRLR